MTELHPYPAYRDSEVLWLEGIPRQWGLSHGGALLQQKQVKNRGMIENTVLSLSYGRIVVKPPEKLHGLVPESFETYQIVEPGNIIIRPTDLQNDKNTIRVGIARDRGIITSAYLCFSTRKPLMAEYAYLLLLGYDLKKVFYGMGSGLRQNLDWSDFKRLPMLLPPANEQMAIVAYANQIDRRINHFIRNRRRLIGVLKEQKQAIINRAVTRGHDPNVPLKPTGIDWLGDIPEHWEIGPLKRFVCQRAGAIKAGPFGSQLTAAEMQGNEFKVYTQRNVIDRDMDKGLDFVSRAKFNDLRAFEVFSGDVLVTSRGTIGRTTLVTRDCHQGVLHPCLLRVQTDTDRLLPEFLMTVIQDSQLLPCQLKLFSNATTIDVIYAGTLASIIVPVPPIEEQRRILSFITYGVTNLDKAISGRQREIDLIREYRTRLIADVVTGKVDLRHLAPPPEAMAAEDENLDDGLDYEMPEEDDLELVEEATDADD